MIRSLLSDIKRANFSDKAYELMNHYCVLKHDSRFDSDVIFRFAEVEFYLYDAAEQVVDVKTYSRDCRCGEWFFHSSGVDIAFETVREGDELVRFGGILIRGVEVYRQDDGGQWVLTGVIGGPKLSMYEMFNHAVVMPEVVNCSLSTMKRIWVAFPMSFSPSKASMAKVSLRPFTSVRVAVAERIAPIGDGARCDVSMNPPTVVDPIGK